MTRKSVTPEQQAQAEARRAKFRKLANEIAHMTPDKRAALAATLPVVATIEGRTLSPTNTMLVVMQCPSATIVGGFKQWLKAGRAVRRGQHGISIWVPIGKPKTGDTGAGETYGDDEPRFICGTVFDVSQTEAIAGMETGRVLEGSAV